MWWNGEHCGVKIADPEYYVFIADISVAKTSAN
jgi:hypothetical protein